MKFYYTYVLECADKSFYVGITSDLEKRMYQHNSGKDKEAYTFSRRPVKLKWYQEFSNPEQAIKFEKQIKGWSRRKKQALIKDDWDKIVEYSKNYSRFGKPSEDEE